MNTRVGLRFHAVWLLAAAPLLVAFPDCNAGASRNTVEFGTGATVDPDDGSDTGFVGWSAFSAEGAEASADSADTCVAEAAELCLEGACPAPEDVQACLEDELDDCSDGTPGGCPLEAGPVDSCSACIFGSSVGSGSFGSCSPEASCDIVYDPTTRTGTSRICVPAFAGEYCLETTFEGEGDRWTDLQRHDGVGLHEEGGDLALTAHLFAGAVTVDHGSFAGRVVSTVPGGEFDYTLTIAGGTVITNTGAGLDGRVTLPAAAANP